MRFLSSLRAIAHGPFVSTALRPIYAGRGTIICLHRIVPRDELSTLETNRLLELTPQDLEALISWARSKGYTLASLGQLCASLRERRGRKMLCLTFDDGYADNLTYALPVLEKHDAPATIFITTDLPDRRLKIWWYAFEEILRDQPDREQRWNVLSRLVHDNYRRNAPHENDEFFRVILGLTDDFFVDLCTRMSLTWADIRQLAQHPLITIGAHTISHPWLSSLSDAELSSELLGSKRRLEQEIRREVTLFAYPFGGAGTCGPREFEAAKNAGFEAAVTTRMGNVVDAHENHLWALPRHCPEEPNFSLSALDSRMSGFRFFRHGQFRPVVTQ